MDIFKPFFFKSLFDFSRSPILSAIRSFSTAEDGPIIVNHPYAASAGGRLTADWAGSFVTDSVFHDARRLRARSRDLCRNNPYVLKAKNYLVDSIVGKGFKMQSAYCNDDGTANNEIRDEIEKFWKSFCMSCDLSGRMTFEEMTHLALSEMVETGDCIIRLSLRSAPNSDLPFSVEILEAENLDDSKTSTESPIIRQGVEINSYRRPIAYWISAEPARQAYLFGGTVGSERLLARNIVHLYRIERPSSARGVPWLSPVMLQAKNAYELERAFMVRSRFEACLMAFRVTPDPLVAQEGIRPDEAEYLEPGLIKNLAPGDSILPYDPSGTASANAIPFLNNQYQGIAAGANVPLHDLTGDYSQVNYSSSRMAEIVARRYWRYWQKYLQDHFCQKVFERAMDAAALSGKLSFSRDYFIDPKKYCCVKWYAQPFGILDLDKEIRANALGLQTNQLCLTEILAERGVDFAEFVAQRAEEIRIMKEAGIYNENITQVQ